jgi:hypothetical protein
MSGPMAIGDMGVRDPVMENHTEAIAEKDQVPHIRTASVAAKFTGLGRPDFPN